MNEIKPGFDGMPPFKNQQTQYTDEEKIKIAAKAHVAGVRCIADLYGLKWQTVASWKRLLKKTERSAVAPVDNVNKKSAETAETEAAVVAETAVIIQSPDGHEITVDEIISKIGGVTDKIYIRVDKNAAYWVKGEENGSVNLW